MTPVVIDASAGVELAADTSRGRSLRAVLPTDAVPWVPEVFFVECGAVLRRWDLNRVLTSREITTAVDQLLVWPLRIAQVRPCSATHGVDGPTSAFPTRCTSLWPRT